MLALRAPPRLPVRDATSDLFGPDHHHPAALDRLYARVRQRLKQIDLDRKSRAAIDG